MYLRFRFDSRRQIARGCVLVRQPSRWHGFLHPVRALPWPFVLASITDAVAAGRGLQPLPPSRHHASEDSGRRLLCVARTRAGLAAAKRMGRTGGRPAKLLDDDIDIARTLLANPDITVAEVADRLGVSPATLYRYLPAARSANSSP
jgi:Helix-turn-helix domain of resolvase